MYKVSIVTLSDKGFKGEREDISYKTAKDIIDISSSFEFESYSLLPDEKDMIVKELIALCNNENVNLIVTTGGTGFSKRDVTPEATLEVIEKRASGIPEAIRAFSLKITDRAMLSRAEAGIRNNTLIVNLPGSPKAVKESLEYILPSIEHGLDILTGADGECAR